MTKAKPRVAALRSLVGVSAGVQDAKGCCGQSCRMARMVASMNLAKTRAVAI
jgi:hypothetical protein